MAGDGYRLRARVRFEKTAGYDSPNAAALDKRYSKLPQAQPAKKRVWRKTSAGAYLQWTAAPSFGPAWDDLHKRYAIAHVQMATETGISDGDVQRRPSQIFATDTDADDLGLVRRSVATTSAKASADWMRVSDDSPGHGTGTSISAPTPTSFSSTTCQKTGPPTPRT